MLYIIGLGLNEKGISIEGKEAVKKCKKVYLESYTVEFPYELDKLEKVIGKKIGSLSRGDVESDKLVSEAKKGDIGLLVYGSPLFATTHIGLINDCKDKRVKVRVIHASCIFDNVAETGLQLYKFGKITSMPTWQDNFKPDSFLDIVKDNMSIDAHTLILIDIGLSFSDALDQLVSASNTKNVKLDKIIVCSRLGTSSGKIYYGSVNKLKRLKKKIKNPFCFVISGKMHFLEERVLKGLLSF